MARPFRFTFILALTALATILAAVGGWRYARASAPVNGPIVLLSVDTLRADHLPVYGYHRIKTPAIDALARDGVVFERAYTHAPQTLAQYKASHGPGCGCCSSGKTVKDKSGTDRKKPARLVTKTKSGAKGFPTARPWMISH